MEELAPAGAAVTEDDWDAARSRNRRTAYLSCVIGVIVGPLIGILAVYLTALFATGGARYPVMGLWMAVLVAPMAIVMSLRSVKEQEKSDSVIATLHGNSPTMTGVSAAVMTAASRNWPSVPRFHRPA